MRRPVLLFAFSMFTAWVSAQSPTVIDSLLARVDTTRNDTDQLALCFTLGQQLFRTPAGKAWNDRAMALADGLMLSADTVVATTAAGYLAAAQCNAGLFRWYAGDINDALTLFSRSAAYWEQHHDTSTHAILMNNIGMLYEDIEDRKNSLRYYKRSIREALSVNDRENAAHTSLLVSDVLCDANELDSAWHYARLARAAGDSVLAWNAVQIMAQIQEKKGLPSQARALFAQSLRMLEGAGGNVNWPFTFAYLRKARFHLRQSEPDSALSAAKTCVALAEARDLQHQLCRCAFLAGSIQKRLGDLRGARASLERGMAVAKRIGVTGRTSDEFNVVTGSALLSEVYAALGEPSLALDMAAYNRLMRDSVEHMGDRKSLYLFAFGEQQMADSMAYARKSLLERFEFQQQVERERTRRNIFLFSGLGLLVFGIVIFRQRHRVQKALRRSDELLLNILPLAIAEELKAKGEAEAKQIEQVTVLFTDFKGFTTMSEQLSPKELVRDIHECFSAFDRIAEKRCIEKIKTIGDAYMAAGGLPTPNTTHALDVVKAALEIRDFIAEGKAHKMAAGLPYFEIRIGIHTGPVVAGIVGVKKFAYDIWGDTVNTASRMESSGEVGQVNISQATYALVKNEPGLTFTPRGKVQAKGKGEMEMYFVRRSGEDA
jgi:class 3 adenylate cyclase